MVPSAVSITWRTRCTVPTDAMMFSPHVLVTVNGSDSRVSRRFSLVTVANDAWAGMAGAVGSAAQPAAAKSRSRIGAERTGASRG